MINYTLFWDLWDTALNTDSRNDFVAKWSTAPTDLADAFTLESIYTMAYGGCFGIRTVMGVSQRAFAEMYEIPRRSIEDWESGRHLPSGYTTKMLGYAVLSDVITLRSEGFIERQIEEAVATLNAADAQHPQHS